MKKIYNIIFVITLLLIGGLITNVDAVSLSNQDGRITVIREIGNVHNPVTNTFNYLVEEGDENPVSVTGFSENFSIVFNNTAPVIPSGQWTGTATGTGTLDLTGINFTKVGDYTFNINESGSINGDINNEYSYPIDLQVYSVVVSVRNQVDSNNHPTGTLVASVAYITSGYEKESSIGFSSAYNDQLSFAVTKEVQGNMADPDEYFKVLLNVDCPTGNTYQMEYYDTLNETFDVARTISYNGSSINRLPNGNSTDGYYATYTCGSNNYVYLKHGEKVTLKGLLNDTRYSFTEQDAIHYETYINGSDTNSKVSESMMIHGDDGGVKSNVIGKEYKTKNLDNRVPTFNYDDENNDNLILNYNGSVVPTGVILKYLPYAILVLVVIGSLTLFVIAKKRNRKEESID